MINLSLTELKQTKNLKQNLKKLNNWLIDHRRIETYETIDQLITNKSVKN